jgi:uncharacterized membrane protein YphA (DoxX/SURF4 family)
MNREQQIKRRLWQFMVAFSIALLVLTWAEVSGHVSLRVMAFVVILLAVTGWVFLTVNFSKIRRQYPPTEISIADADNPATRKKITRNIRLCQGGLIIMPLLLVNGLLTLSGEPMVATIIGIAINLGLTWLFFEAYQIHKAKLQGLDAARTATTTEHNMKMKADNS